MTRIPKRITCQPTRLSSHLLRLIPILALVLTVSTAKAQAPATGDNAPNFTLLTPTGSSVSLESETRKGTTVLVILRGFPGYQCPYCVRQVHDFVEHSSDFATKKVRVLFVYPGPPAALDDHAKDFLAKAANLPANVQLVVDPDYKVTNLYGLRWDAPHETAYPSTFILDKHRTIKFEKISHAHGDRATAEDVLKQIGQ
ncbi:MAG: redoxin domain-containing protein [Candidatus Sulfotelmatobacter sp.]|jgi:thioredoxin-dependent peroxiredoxin